MAKPRKRRVWRIKAQKPKSKASLSLWRTVPAKGIALASQAPIEKDQKSKGKARSKPSIAWQQALRALKILAGIIKTQKKKLKIVFKTMK
jgi:hypothetical protein